MEEGERGYVEIVELSIEDREYGLDIPANISSVEEYVPLLFKNWVRCSNQVFTPFVNYLFELLPFSTEFFTLATFDAIHTISNFGHRNSVDEMTPLMDGTNTQVNIQTSKLRSVRRMLSTTPPYLTMKMTTTIIGNSVPISSSVTNSTQQMTRLVTCNLS